MGARHYPPAGKPPSVFDGAIPAGLRRWLAEYDPDTPDDPAQPCPRALAGIARAAREGRVSLGDELVVRGMPAALLRRVCPPADWPALVSMRNSPILPNLYGDRSGRGSPALVSPATQSAPSTLEETDMTEATTSTSTSTSTSEAQFVALLAQIKPADFGRVLAELVAIAEPQPA